MDIETKRKKRKTKLGFGLDFRAGNYICPKIKKLFQEAGLNYNKFLCGGCTKKTHYSINTGIWKDKLECEATMVGGLTLSFKFTGRTHKSCDEFLKILRRYIFSKYKPDEMKLRKILLDNK